MGTNKALRSELDWITTNVAFYDSLLHAEAVKQNIIKRYRIRELEDEIGRVTKELDRQLGTAQGNPIKVSRDE